MELRYLRSMSALAKLPIRMCVQEFIHWEPGDGMHYELVDGEPRAMAPASTVDAFLQNELGGLIRNHLREHNSQCEVLANPGPGMPAEHLQRMAAARVTR